ncbi:AraC family transcriptional regulator [Tenacibaculum tangerinum]|uniref:AraC family transcriptional regulator n=1 Tax=Tenacibaculum tangerinum TaxID=3038772 RepID=A0ABY8L284_9FLAO|nr:AraC family transcriptional regulator [Tenacibaculum tangerinum]WGH75381.1 AraC family transcriptional regulator [Tenacibaculum tangerinum]
MINIHIEDDNQDAIITSFAETLNIPIDSKSSNFSKLCFPESLGNGCIQQHNYKSGVSVLDVRLKLKEEMSLLFEQGVSHPLKIIINKKARLKHQFHDNKDAAYLNEQGSVALASIAKQNHTIFLPKNQYISLLSIRIDRKSFESYLENHLEEMDKNLSTLLRDVNGVNPYFHEGYYNYQTSEILDKYFNSNFSNIVETLYLEGLTYQLISLQFEAISTNSKLSDDQKRMSKTLQEKILKAARIIKSDIAHFTTVANLSDEINLSVKKTQQGFNELFGMSVLEYVTNYRVEKTKELLLETDLTISEISYQLGISSPGYLSKIFKRTVGVSPLEYRKVK